MSGKRKKQQARRRPAGRPANAPASPSAAPQVAREGAEDGAMVGTSAPVPAAARTAASRPGPASRYAGSVTAPRRGAAVVTNAGTIDIDERVPYFAQDLRRILVTAVLMVVAIIAASFLLH
ncbi:MAG: hypothetical protein NVS3B24_07230 [Candidatus Dormibacteria bacterium]